MQPPPAPTRRNAGYAMLLVLIALGLASALGAAMILARGPAAAVASNLRHTGDARALAETALELAVAMAIDDAAFRNAYAHDAWSADQAFQNGTFRVKFTDPNDADLADDPTDDVRITVLANVQGRTHEVSALFTPPKPRLLLEAGKITLGPTPQSFSFQNAYTNPVVVCSVNTVNNAPHRPVVVRVRNVTATGFEAWLQNPGDQSTPVPDEVFFLAAEQGAHNFDGMKFEAWTFHAHTTDRKASTDALPASYLQPYTQPIVLGQVMTANDPKWSVFWARGPARGNPPTPATLRIGKHVGEDPDFTRANETLGVIVFDAGQYHTGNATVQAFLSENIVGGIGNAGTNVFKPDFPQEFSQPPKYAVVTQAGENDGDMSFAVMPGSDPLHDKKHIHLAVDEDQVGDLDRSHVPEEVAVVVFSDAPQAASGAGLKVVMLVDDAESRSQEDDARIALLQSWGVDLTLCEKDDSNAVKLAKMNAADVVYISAKNNDSEWSHLIDDLAVPFVNEHEDLVDDLGFASDAQEKDEQRIDLVNVSHPIMAGLSVQADFRVLTSSSDMLYLRGTLAPGLTVLAERDYSATDPTLAVLDTGALRYNNQPSPSRRVQMPWGDGDFDPSKLNAAGQDLLLKSLTWAAGGGTADNTWRTPPRLVWEEPAE